MSPPKPEVLPLLRSRRRARAGTFLAARLLLRCVAAAVVTLTAAAAAWSAPPGRLESPRLAELSRGFAASRDAALPKRRARRLLNASSSYWGGAYTATTGETVTVYVSSSYPEDPAIAQRWADFLASLVHGPELSSLTMYLAPSGEVSSICGPLAIACYGGSDNLLVAPGEDPSSDTSAEAVVTHEYGHHVAAHRSNAPWAAIDYGTKRWATYEQVCSSARAGRLYPGAEELPRYQLNPGEAFAETYRVLNERKAGIAEAPWDVVAQSLHPDATALSLAGQDVTTPWRASAAIRYTGYLSKRARARSFTVATPLDGRLKLTLRAAHGTRVALDVYSPASTRVVHAAGTSTISLGATVCGARSASVRVGRIRGAGAFRLSVTAP